MCLDALIDADGKVPCANCDTLEQGRPCSDRAMHPEKWFRSAVRVRQAHLVVYDALKAITNTQSGNSAHELPNDRWTAIK